MKLIKVVNVFAILGLFALAAFFGSERIAAFTGFTKGAIEIALICVIAAVMVAIIIGSSFLVAKTSRGQIVVRPRSFYHFDKDYGNGNYSLRLLLPGRDGSVVKATKFHGVKWSKFPDLRDLQAEFVYCLTGSFRLTIDGSSTEIGPGAYYYIPAGMLRTLEVLETGDLLCVFAQDGGPMPDDK